jgi:hypothetical protein
MNAWGRTPSSAGGAKLHDFADKKKPRRAALDWVDEDICPYVVRGGAWFVVAGCRIIAPAWLTKHRWF